MNIGNMKRFLTYLEALPENYEHFDMYQYCNKHDDPHDLLAYRGSEPLECGHVLCLAGHMAMCSDLPAPMEMEAWSRYSCRVMGLLKIDSGVWTFLFDSAWKTFDNSLSGAIGRLKAVIAEPNQDVYGCYHYDSGTQRTAMAYWVREGEHFESPVSDIDKAIIELGDSFFHEPITVSLINGSKDELRDFVSLKSFDMFEATDPEELWDTIIEIANKMVKFNNE